MVTVSSLTLDRMRRELLSSWMRVKISASSDSFSGICITLRSSCSVDWRWISFWGGVRGSLGFSTSDWPGLTSWKATHPTRQAWGWNIKKPKEVIKGSRNTVTFALSTFDFYSTAELLTPRRSFKPKLLQQKYFITAQPFRNSHNAIPSQICH